MVTAVSAVSPQQRRVTAGFNVLRLLDRRTSTCADVADAFGEGSMLSNQLLKVARSPLCGVRSPDLTPARAVVLLGFVTVRKFVVLSLCRDLGSVKEGQEADQWKEALWVGIAAEEITRRIDESLASEALMAGMMGNMADEFGSQNLDVALDEEAEPLDPRLALYLEGAEAVAALMMEAQPALPTTAAIDEALQSVGLAALNDGRLPVDIRRGHDLYASFID